MPELAAGDLAGGREHVRQDVIEGRLQPLVVLLLAGAAHLRRGAPARDGVSSSSDGGVGAAFSRDLGPDLGHLLPDLLVGECLVVRLELVDPRHDRAQPREMGFVAAADEAGQEAAHGMAEV